MSDRVNLIFSVSDEPQMLREKLLFLLFGFMIGFLLNSALTGMMGGTSGGSQQHSQNYNNRKHFYDAFLEERGVAVSDKQ